jgi:hypothetical protein
MHTFPIFDDDFTGTVQHHLQESLSIAVGTGRSPRHEPSQRLTIRVLDNKPSVVEEFLD